ncbi:MAG: hypothetical protein ACJ74O_07410 [Frankiaceae bacterium]
MMNRNARTTGAALVLLTGLLAPVALAGPASASGGGVTARGACGTATWKLKAAHDDGRIQVELEVDSNRAGQAWSVRITDNGTTVFSGTRTTLAPSGSFEVRKLIANRAGADVIRARATRGTQVCAGSVTL